MFSHHVWENYWIIGVGTLSFNNRSLCLDNTTHPVPLLHVTPSPDAFSSPLSTFLWLLPSQARHRRMASKSPRSNHPKMPKQPKQPKQRAPHLTLLTNRTREVNRKRPKRSMTTCQSCPWVTWTDWGVWQTSPSVVVTQVHHWFRCHLACSAGICRRFCRTLAPPTCMALAWNAHRILRRLALHWEWIPCILYESRSRLLITARGYHMKYTANWRSAENLSVHLLASVDTASCTISSKNQDVDYVMMCGKLRNHLYIHINAFLMPDSEQFSEYSTNVDNNMLCFPQESLLSTNGNMCHYSW